MFVYLLHLAEIRQVLECDYHKFKQKLHYEYVLCEYIATLVYKDTPLKSKLYYKRAEPYGVIRTKIICQLKICIYLNQFGSSTKSENNAIVFLFVYWFQIYQTFLINKKKA